MDLSRREALLAALGGISAAAPAKSPGVPTVPFGKHRVSRIIVGGNPVSGISHLNNQLSREMVDYFTSANIKRLLRDCERAGINTWQARGDKHILRILHEYRQEGGAIQWIGQTATEIVFDRNLREMHRESPIGIYHHGSLTDRLWAAGKIDDARDNLKRIRDTGTRAGLGTHIPQVIDYIESNGWDVDFYMTCVYNLSRTPEQAAQVAGHAVKGEYFHDPDREAMLRRVAQTKKPCLIFKVYAATRHSGTAGARRAALKLAFSYAKPTDAVVIGMFPKHSEQVEENCRLVIEAAAAKSS
jgi:hypothetical protein